MDTVNLFVGYGPRGEEVWAPASAFPLPPGCLVVPVGDDGLRALGMNLPTAADVAELRAIAQDRERPLVERAEANQKLDKVLEFILSVLGLVARTGLEVYNARKGR